MWEFGYINTLPNKISIPSVDSQLPSLRQYLWSTKAPNDGPHSYRTATTTTRPSAPYTISRTCTTAFPVERNFFFFAKMLRSAPNMIIARSSAQFEKDGIMFLRPAPGTRAE
ncbi:hypothetical protein PMIN02_004242 [Paraphaeosphaeria minitans]